MDYIDKEPASQPDAESKKSRKEESRRSSELGYLIEFLNKTKDSLKAKMMLTSTYKSESSREINYLRDIDYLPMTYLSSRYPLGSFLFFYGQVTSTNDENGEILHFGSDEDFVCDPYYLEGSKGSLEPFYYFVEQISDTQLESYLKKYVRHKKSAVSKIDGLCKVIGSKDSRWTKEISDYEEHKKWLIGIKEEIMTGNHVRLALNKFAVSAYQTYRNNFLIDQIMKMQSNVKLEILKRTNRDIELIKKQHETEINNLRKRNDLLQDMLRSSKPECELWFTGLDEIAQQDYDPRKVSLKLEYEPWEEIDDRKLAKDKYKATNIYISYEGVNDSGECKPLTLYNGPCRIRDEEKKLLIKLAFYQGNAAKLKEILAESKADCVAHLNTMYNTIFNLTGRSNFIDKENGILKVKLDYKRPKSF